MYANLFYETKINNNFYEYIPTQQDNDNNFIISTPKQSHRSRLSPVVLMKIKSINGVQLLHPLVTLCNTRNTGTLIKDTSLPFGAKLAVTNEVTVSTTTHGTHQCNELTFLDHISLP